ncbi:MAG: tetratricopeptide repeat protein [Chloroflexota bacterium]|nr:MAG: tetratricopeptide repeat protein [Chloroflexota bacterium]
MNRTGSNNLYLFGAFRLEKEGAPLKLGTRKIQALLAYLALHPQAHTREKLAALFWGDSTDKAARHSLNVALNTLRKQIAPDLLLTDRATVQLNPEFPLQVDAKQIENLGFLISDLRNADTHEIINPKSQIIDYSDLLADFYDDWILSEREQYRALYLDALFTLVQQSRAAGEYARAVEYAERVLKLDPTNERAHQHLMFCYAVTGDRQKALAQYEKCLYALREDLAVQEPAPETVTLYDWIRQTPASPSFAARLTNLPIPLSSFIGRATQLSEIRESISRARLVTLTGAGGSGKTRLAIQVGMALLETFRDGVWWIDLASLNEAERVAETVVRVLGLPLPLNQSPIETLIKALRGQARLLIFDNCEHLLDACAGLIETLLRACPELKILTTSREPLSLTGEVVYLVPTLTFPNPNALSVTSLLMQYEAVRLFVERAQAVNSQFALNENNAQMVAQICARLDGIPLVLELAAARARSMSMTEIVEHLDHRFQFLAHGERTAPLRQQTLHAMIDWSYSLLTEDERILFRKLAVFAGDFSFEAVAYVSNEAGGTKTECLDLVARLVEKSLVRVSAKDETTRYTMLETIREFAREELNAAGEAERARQAHFHYFLELAQRTHKMWDYRAFIPLDREMENLRAALTWVAEKAIAPNATDTSISEAVEFIYTLWDYWCERGHFAELNAWLEKLPGLDRLSTRAAMLKLFMACCIELGQGHSSASLALARKGAARARALQDKELLALMLLQNGFAERALEQYDEAMVVFDQAQVLFFELDDKINAHHINYFKAEAYAAKGELRIAASFWEQGLAWLQTHGDKDDIAWGLEGLGNLARLEGELERAKTLYRTSTQLKYENREIFGLQFSLSALAQLAVAEAQPARAVRLWGAADRLREKTNHEYDPQHRLAYWSELPRARETLGESAFEAEWARGRGWTLEQAVAYAMQEQEI